MAKGDIKHHFGLWVNSGPIGTEEIEIGDICYPTSDGWEPIDDAYDGEPIAVATEDADPADVDKVALLQSGVIVVDVGASTDWAALIDGDVAYVETEAAHADLGLIVSEGDGTMTEQIPNARILFPDEDIVDKIGEDNTPIEDDEIMIRIW